MQARNNKMGISDLFFRSFAVTAYSDFSIQITGGKAVRYVKVTTTDAGMCPEDHLKPGQQSRYRFDEIQVF